MTDTTQAAPKGEGTDEGKGTRLNKWLAETGVCSRREADAWITSVAQRFCVFSGEPTDCNIRQEALQPLAQRVYPAFLGQRCFVFQILRYGIMQQKWRLPLEL